MELSACMAWGHTHLFIGPQQWERERARAPLCNFEVLDLDRAIGVLFLLAHEDRALLCRLGRAVLPSWSPEYPRFDSECCTYDDIFRLRETLTDALGKPWSKRGAPPVWARFFICRRRPRAAPVSAAEPRNKARDAVEAARHGPRGWVAIEALTEGGEAVAHLPLEVVLGDAEVVVRSTDALGQLRLDSIPQGRCSIRLPSLDGSAWRSAEGEAPVRFTKTYKRAHVVRRGESLTRIAAQYGIKGWRKVWDTKDNEPLRKRRASPHLLCSGDEVVIPALESCELTRPTDRTHRIVIREAHANVRIRLRDMAGHALAGLQYEYAYELGSRLVRASGSAPSDAEGWLQEVLPLGADSLEVLTKRPRLWFRFPLHELAPARQADTHEPIGAGVDTRLAALGYAHVAEAGVSACEAVAVLQAQELGRADARGELDADTAAVVEQRYGA